MDERHGRHAGLDRQRLRNSSTGRISLLLCTGSLMWTHLLFCRIVTWCHFISFDVKVFVWHCLCRWSHGQHARHLRRPPLHQNADSHQPVHFEFGGGRRMFSHWHSIHYDDDGPGILAIRQRHVQGEITSMNARENL